MLLVGATAVYHTSRTLRVDEALQAAFGLHSCADQSVLADTLDAATPEDVVPLRSATAAIVRRFNSIYRHDPTASLLVLDFDLSPLLTCRKAEHSERGHFGHCRSKTRHKLVRVRAPQYQQTLYEDVVPAKTAEALGVLQRALEHTERLLDMDGDNSQATARRARTKIRLDRGWGSDPIITWLLRRSYQVTGKVKSSSRVRKLVAGIELERWKLPSSEGREVTTIPEPTVYTRLVQQYAVRTPFKEQKRSFYTAVLFTTRTDLDQRAVVDHYDDCAGIEAELKGGQAWARHGDDPQIAVWRSNGGRAAHRTGTQSPDLVTPLAGRGSGAHR